MGGRARSWTIRTSGASIWAKDSRCRPASGASDRFPSPFSLTSKSRASFFPHLLDGVEPTSRSRAGFGREMALQAKLHLRQTQALVMTPQLMQSIKLLQLTHIELERFIDEEIERNPLLERAEAEDQLALVGEEQQAGQEWHDDG